MSETIEIKCTGASEAYLTELIPFQGELKTLSKVNYEKLKKAILHLGFSEPFSVWVKDGQYKLLNGHQRHRVLTKMLEEEGYSIPKLPVNFIEAKDEKEAKLKVLSLTSQFGEITDDGLYEFMMNSQINFDDVASTFRFPEINLKLFEESYFKDESDGSEDHAPGVKENDTRVKFGDLYLLGDHRLVCGDSTDPSCIDKLMNGEKADTVFTDPPYNLGFEYNSHDDNMSQIEYKSFCVSWYENLKSVCDKIVITPGTKNLSMWLNIDPNPQGIACWIKKNWITSCKISNLQQWEPILFYGPFTRARASDLFEINRTYQKDVGDSHTCPKQIELLEDILKHYAGATVLDVFGGSGSTLIACEKTKKRCFMMELDPQYCSVILDRWAQFTGNDPRRSDGVNWSSLK